MVIGLTGGTGSGKSYASALLKKHGAQIIDADQIAHDIILPGRPAYTELVVHFGNAILHPDGTIFRKKLGSIVFSDANELAFLNACTHKHIRAEIFDALKAAEPDDLLVIDAPLLSEAGLLDICDQVWVVFAEEEVRLARIMARDGISRLDAQNRIRSQKSFSEYQSLATVVLDNSRDLNHLEEQIVNHLPKKEIL